MVIEHLEALVLNLLPIVHKLCVRRYSDTKSSLKIKFHVLFTFIFCCTTCLLP